MTQQGPPAAQVFNDRYELVRHVARGGMAQVYLARDLLLDRPVALKVLFPELSVDNSFVERFRREAQAAANLSHPNIVSVYDWGEGERTYFIVMEYVDGETLAQMIRKGPLDSEQAASIAADVAGALAFAHTRGVIHRDVKPGNVLIDRTGQVKVADFGIARAAGVQEGLTQTGAVMGTASYFSPEQAQGLPVDARSDVYSLGVVLYEMVVGKAPFEADNPVAIAYKHVREAAVAPTQANRAVPVALEHIILRAMAKDPAARYQSAAELRADLQRYLQGSTVFAEAAPATATVAATRVQERYPTVTPTPPLPDDEEEPGRRTGAYVAILVVMLAVLAGLLFLLGRQLGVFDSSSTRKVTIPADVVGKPVAAAQSELQGLGLKSQVQIQTDPAPAGNVVDTNPKPGTSVKSGSTVTLLVSGGPGQVNLPDVTGQSVTAATQTLKAAGFNVQTVTATSSIVPANQVISQSPPGNSQQTKGATVTLTVSSGPAPVTVPDEAGKDPTTAANDLGQLQLKTTTSFEPSDSTPSGQVSRTSPAAGQSVAVGSTVTIFVSTGPPQAAVPSVIGLTPSAASATLTQAGFKVAITTGAATSQAQNNTVISQSPNAGTKEARGSTVTIVIGTYTPPPTTTSTTVASSTTSTT
jgi:serine/threonine-protein kinase